MRKIFMILLMSMFLISFTSAIVEVNYSVYEGVIENNGLRTETNLGVENFQVRGFECLDFNCQTLGNELENLNPVYSQNEVSVYFPTEEQTVNGYLLYFSKDGRIGWEQYNIEASGDGSYFGGEVYLSRKRSGYAPIQNMVVANEVHPGTPLEINLSVGIDAETYSAIEDSSQTGLNYHEFVRTEVTLDIFEDDGSLAYSETKILEIPYSSSDSVSFEYAFSETGLKKIVLTTDVLDEKIINSLKQSSVAEVRVIAQGKLNYSYSILNGLTMTPLHPELNESVSFDVDYFSRFIDEFGNSSSIGTDLEIIYYLNGGEREHSTVNFSSDGDYSFSYIFPEEGFWEVKVIASPNPRLGDEIINDSRSLVFFVYNSSNNQSGNETNQNITFDYFARLFNLESTSADLESGDIFGFMFDYELLRLDNLGNRSLMDGLLEINISLDGNESLQEVYNLTGRDHFYFDFEVDNGAYEINFSLCPSINGSVVGHCQHRFVSFNVSGNETPDQVKKKKTFDDDSGFDFGPSISINDGSYIGEKSIFKNKGIPSWLYLILLLISLCLILFALIVFILFMKRRNLQRSVN